MANNLVFNVEPGQLKVQIFGSETNQALSTTSGRLNIQSITDTVSTTFGDINGSVTFGSVTFGSVTFGDINGSVTFGSVTFGAINGSVTFGSVTFGDINGSVTFGSVTFGSVTFDAVTFGEAEIKHTSRYVATDTATSVLSSTTVYAGILQQDVSPMSMVSFAVHNRGAAQVSIKVEVSPNASFWILDTSAFTLDGNVATVFVPKYFLKYARLSYASLTNLAEITFDAYYQAHV
ncbi:MAG: DUF6385 domain-containing protein [Bacillota bacterium]